MPTATPIFPQSVQNFAAQITNATGTGSVNICAGGTNGTKLESLSVTNTDTAAHDIQLIMTISSVAYLLATVSIPGSSGNVDTAPSVDIFRSAQWPGLAYDANGNKILYVANGATLSMQALVAVASGKTINAFASGGNF